MINLYTSLYSITLFADFSMTGALAYLWHYLVLYCIVLCCIVLYCCYCFVLFLFLFLGAVALPRALHSLMVTPDSPILDFYPENFEIDMNGKKFEWQGVALLPFIDQDRLLQAVRPVEDSLSPAMRRRNQFGRDAFLVHSSHPTAQTIQSVLAFSQDILASLPDVRSPLTSPLLSSPLPSPLLSSPSLPQHLTLLYTYLVLTCRLLLKKSRRSCGRRECN